MSAKESTRHKIQKGHKSEKSTLGYKREKETKMLWGHKTANPKSVVESGFKQMTKNVYHSSSQTEGGRAQPQVVRGLEGVANAVTGGAGT